MADEQSLEQLTRPVAPTPTLAGLAPPPDERGAALAAGLAPGSPDATPHDPAPAVPGSPQAERGLKERHFHRDRLRRRLLAGADLAAVYATLVFALVVTSAPSLPRELLWGLLTLPAWLLLLKVYGLYERDPKRISYTTVDDVPQLFHVVVVGALIRWVLFDLGPSTKLAVHTVLVSAGAAMVAIIFVRTVVRSAARRVLAPERVLILGENKLSVSLVRKMRAHPEYALDPVGVDGVVPTDIADLEKLKSLAERHRVDRIILADTGAETHQLLKLLSACRQLQLKVSIVPTVFEAIGPATEVDELEGITVLGLNPPVLPRSSRLAKRAIDVVGAGALLLLSLPLQATIAVAIRLDSSGPVLFSQRRVGRGGQRFRILKFRTMVDDAEQLRDQLIGASNDPNWLHLEQDPRITRVGGLLRRTSLDELPQLWNVLKGEMSLVGPRPLPESEDSMIEGWGRGRLDLTPGITGYWQVLGRNNIPFTEMVKLDYVYVTNWSLWSDVRLILRTLPVVLARRGVN